MKQKTYTAIVPAAGTGSRMGADKPKQYLPLNGKTLLENTLERLIQHPKIDRVVLPLHRLDRTFEQLPISRCDWLQTVIGGNERADSVLAGLEAVDLDQWVLVHDAARPCVRHEDLDNLLALADTDSDGGILACRVTDTIKRADPCNSHSILTTEPRDGLWHAMTPQFFPARYLHESLLDALAQGVAVTDEASAIEWAGGKVNLVAAATDNIKVTRPQDLALAEYFLSQQEEQQ